MPSVQRPDASECVEIVAAAKASVGERKQAQARWRRVACSESVGERSNLTSGAGGAKGLHQSQVAEEPTRFSTISAGVLHTAWRCPSQEMGMSHT